MRSYFEAKDASTFVARLKLAPADKSMVYRLVGGHEYSNALLLLGDLLKKSSKEEMEVYNEIIRNRPEFDLFIRKQALLPRENNDAKGEKTNRKSTEINHSMVKRNGLDWLMALARVEIAGTLAAYSNVESPLEAVGPSPFEKRAFVELVRSDAISQIRLLKNDRNLAKVLKESKKEPGAETVAYLRRLRVVGELVSYSSQSMSEEEYRTSRRNPYADYVSSLYATNQELQKSLEQHVAIRGPADYQVRLQMIPACGRAQLTLRKAMQAQRELDAILRNK